MDTKHKVILVVFAAFFAVVLLIYVLGGKSKVEKFEEENEEEEFTDSESEDTKPTPSKQPKATKNNNKNKKESEAPKEDSQAVDYMKEAMNYLNNMNLPFQMKKEVFSELFSEEGINKLESFTTLPDLQKFVTGIVDMTKSIASPKTTQEKFNNSSLLTGLEDVKKQISNLTSSLSSVAQSIEKFEKEAETSTSNSLPKPMHPSQPSTALLPSSKTTGNKDVIEGFENVRSNYALF